MGCFVSGPVHEPIQRKEDDDVPLMSASLRNHLLDASRRAVERCHLCPSKADKQCSNCKLVRYCNSVCQGLDFKDHKTLCRHYENGQCKHFKGVEKMGLLKYLESDLNGVVEHFQAIQKDFEQSAEEHLASLLRFDKEAKDAVKQWNELRRKKKEAKERSNMKPIPASEVPKELKGIETFRDYYFENWGQTIRRNLGWMFVPHSKKDVQAIVKWAASNKLRIRCSGYTHSWTDFYADNGQVLVCMLSPHVMGVPPSEPPTTGDLHSIELLDRRSKDDGKMLVKIGAAVSNDQFRVFANQHDLCLPCNVVLVENTFGGSNAGMSHGSGISTKILPDYVYEIEIVNSKGEAKAYSYETHSSDVMRAVCAAFGTFGVTVSLTFKVNPIAYAVMNPQQEPREEAVPPPEITSGPLYRRFVDRIHNHYYNEFFWFPYQRNMLVNCWNNDGKKSDSQEHPPPLTVKLQAVENYLAGVLNTSIVSVLPPTWQAKIFGTFTMAFVGMDNVTTTQMDAIHFRRGIHNMPLLNYELQVPLIESKAFPGKPDVNVLQKLWWDSIKIIEAYKEKEQAPVRLALEMRVYQGSDMYLAPQSGNQWTLAIEVLSFNTPYEEFIGGCQALTDSWVENAPKGATVPRPHLAKAWTGLSVQKQSMQQYMKTKGYIINGVNQLEVFKEVHRQQDPDPDHMFSNRFIDDFFDWKKETRESKKEG